MNSPSLEELAENFSRVMVNGEPQISPGDTYNIDDYVVLLQQLGYDVEYENIVDCYGFIAQVRINGENHAVWQGGIINSGQDVLLVQRPLDSFEKSDQAG